MRAPYLRSVSASVEYQDRFLGYNHTENASVGEFYDMNNLTSDLYPVISPRNARGTFSFPDGGAEYSAKAIIAKDALCFVSGDRFFINNIPVEGFEVPPVYDEKGNEKRISLVSMGAYVLIFPQRLYINTIDHTDCGSIDAEFVSESGVNFELAKADGTAYQNLPTVKPEEGTETENPFYLDLSQTPNVVMQYSETSKAWVPVSTTYVKISAHGIANSFKEGDGIEISGITAEPFKDLNGSHVIQKKDESEDGSYIVIIGIISTTGSVSNEVTISRKAPELDFVVESQNRLWGCKYGRTEEGVVNQIYASKLGDFKNWRCYQGISSDSFYANLGSDGYFTGAITFQGHPVFFKEGCIHKVYGSVPSNYQVQTTALNGVQKGCDRSLAIVNNVLYYKGIAGIYAYDGSLPVFYSSAFGDESYSSAVAGVFGNKYYVDVNEKLTNSRVLFVLDTQKGIWHKEDGVSAGGFAADGENLYYFDADTGKIHTVDSDSCVNVSWFAETGILGKDTPDRKYVSKMNVRANVSPGARISFFIEYDSFGGWQHLSTVSGRTLQSFDIPLIIRRCDHFRLKIEGRGDVKIHSIAKTIREGGGR